MDFEEPEVQKKYHYHRLGEYSLDEVFSLVQLDPTHRRKGREVYKNSKGTYYVNLNSQRLILFKAKGVICVSCGLVGEFFALERQDVENPHFNLYGVDEEGDEVLFTKDHIIPKSKGGPNTLANFQTMCYPCNSLKGDS